MFGQWAMLHTVPREHFGRAWKEWLRQTESTKLPPSAPALDAVRSEEHRRAAHVTQGRKWRQEKCRLHASLTSVQLMAPDTWLLGELVLDVRGEHVERLWRGYASLINSFEESNLIMFRGAIEKMWLFFILWIARQVNEAARVFSL